jgi:WD40 repeat protein
MCREQLKRPGGNTTSDVTAGIPEMKRAKARHGSTMALYSVAISSDGRYLAAGGGDKLVHVWDLRNCSYLKVLRSYFSRAVSRIQLLPLILRISFFPRS